MNTEVEKKVLQYTTHGETYDVKLKLGKYANGSTRLSMIDAEFEEPIAVCSVRLPETELLSNDVIFVKDYAENFGMFNWLRENKIIESDILMHANNGGIPIKAYKLTKATMKGEFS